MNITKLPSGSYRIRETQNKKIYSITIKYKPSKKEAFELITNKINSQIEYNKSLYAAMKEYIAVNDGTLSPSTIRDYTSRLNRLKLDYNDFIMSDISTINKHLLQKFVNDYSKNHKPKTTRNMYSFIISSIKLYKEDFSVHVNLPQKIKPQVYIPTDNDIKLLLQYVKNTEVECGIKLLLTGLRMSELYALTMQDIGDGFININKATVQSLHGFVVKTTKTTASTRIIPVSKKLTDKIKAQGFVVKGCQKNIRKTLDKFQKEYNIPHFGAHKLRHYYCSLLVSLQIPTPYIMKMGGWESDSVMKNVYTHALSDRDYSNQSISYIDTLDAN